jgi:Domain of unknown function (DUF4145)
MKKTGAPATQVRDMIRSHCNQCHRETRHDVLHAERREGTVEPSEDYGGGYDWVTSHRIIECRGCSYLSFQRSAWTDMDEDASTYNYPASVARQQPSWLYDLPGKYVPIMREIYPTIHGGHKRLAMMGARTVIDLILLDKVGDVGTFVQKLDALTKAGHVTISQSDILSAALEVGNATAHRAHTPAMREVGHVMDIIESILHSTFILPDVAAELKAKTPKRTVLKKAAP